MPRCPLEVSGTAALAFWEISVPTPNVRLAEVAVPVTSKTTSACVRRGGASEEALVGDGEGAVLTPEAHAVSISATAAAIPPKNLLDTSVPPFLSRYAMGYLSPNGAYFFVLLIWALRSNSAASNLGFSSSIVVGQS